MRKTLLLVIVLTAMVLASSVVISAEYYVDKVCLPTGNGSLENPYCLIQTAIDNAVDGDTIFVQPGIYTQYYNHNVRINKSITLIGISNPVINCTNRYNSWGFSIWKNNTIVDGFNITDCYRGIRSGGTFFTCHHMPIYTQNISIKNCNVYHVKRTGIDVCNSIDGLKIINTTITDVYEPFSVEGGIYINYGSISKKVSHLHIENTYVSYCDGVGLLLIPKIEDYLISNVTITDNVVGIVIGYMGVNNVSIIDSKIQDNEEGGIHFEGGRGPVDTINIYNTEISENGGLGGIYFGGNAGPYTYFFANNINIHNNTFMNNLFADLFFGLQFDPLNLITIFSKISIYGNNFFKDGASEKIILTRFNGTDIQINQNNFYGGIGIFNNNTFEVNATHNWWNSSLGPNTNGSSNISGPVLYDPWLCEEAISDWIAIDGICRLVGDPVPILSTELYALLVLTMIALAMFGYKKHKKS